MINIVRAVIGFSAGGSVASKAFAKLIRELGMVPIAHDCSPRIYTNTELQKASLSPRLQDEQAYTNFLAEFLEECDHYIPFLDEELLICARLSDERCTKNRVIFISGPSTIELCNDKLALKNFLREIFIPMPDFAKKAPAIVKPRYGAGGKQALLIKCNSSIDAIKSIADAEDLIIEEYVSGSVVSADVLWDEEYRLLASAYRFRSVGSGVSTQSVLVASTRLLESMENIINKVSNHVKLRGLTSFQFLIRGAEPLLLEINPRAGGSIVHSHLLGSGILYQYFQTCIGVNIAVSGQYQGNRHPRQIIRYYEDNAVFDCE